MGISICTVPASMSRPRGSIFELRHAGTIIPDEVPPREYFNEVGEDAAKHKGDRKIE